MSTVAVDFDGVIHTYERGWADGTIYGDFMPGAVIGLTRLMSLHAVFIHTARRPRQVAQWIEDRSGRALECTTHVPRSGFWNERGSLLITDRKLPAVAYIDDRAVRFSSWDETLAYLEPGGQPAELPMTGHAAVLEAVRRSRGGDAPTQIRGFA
jgi:hypothetical protein